MIEYAGWRMSNRTRENKARCVYQCGLVGIFYSEPNEETGEMRDSEIMRERGREAG